MGASYAQSIIGATEKRRERGAGVAVIGGIGGFGLGRAGRWGVYQDWVEGGGGVLGVDAHGVKCQVGGACRKLFIFGFFSASPKNPASRFFR
ncbi:hypothetical protein BK666_20035 [Pseudomonas frederiksbergensis]|uniref:Uncharacterized protein n=1 Tax=Pseudomonas frederiksbergensis TaxID=104087 RepID=A0A423JZE6_9PSED|nr:hypothetical protein BK666_20035 [Pseudomonas frederiksbergensis]